MVGLGEDVQQEIESVDPCCWQVTWGAFAEDSLGRAFLVGDHFVQVLLDQDPEDPGYEALLDGLRDKFEEQHLAWIDQGGYKEPRQS